MKKTLLFSFLVLSVSLVFAQNPIIKTEHLGNGDRKNVYTIVQNDTVELKQYFANGLLYLHIHNDTLRRYNAQGACEIYIVADTIDYSLQYGETIYAKNVKMQSDSSKFGLTKLIIRGDTIFTEAYYNNTANNPYSWKSKKSMKINNKEYTMWYDNLNNIVGQGYLIEYKNEFVAEEHFEKHIHYYDYKYNIRQDTFVEISNEDYYLEMKNNDTIRYSERSHLAIIKDNIECYYGLIDKRDSSIIVTPQYDYIDIMNYGYVYNQSNYHIVQKNGKYGVIYKGKKVILPIQYEYLKEIRSPYENNKSLIDSIYLVYQENGKRGIITLSGKKILPPQYDDINSINNDYYNVKIGNKFAAIDKDNNIILKPNHDSIVSLDFEKYFVVSTNHIKYYSAYSFVESNYGIVDKNNNIILPNRYYIMRRINTESPNWLTLLYANNLSKQNIYNIDKGFLLDTSKYFSIETVEINKMNYAIIEEKNETKSKYHLLNINTGDFLFKNLEKCIIIKKDNFSLSFLDYNYLIIRENGVEGLYDLRKNKWALPLIFEEINVLFKIEDLFYTSNNGKNITTRSHFIKEIKDIVFVVKENNKYAIIDINGKQISDNKYDALIEYDNNHNKYLILEKDSKAYFVSPFTLPTHAPISCFIDKKENAETNKLTWFYKGHLISKTGYIVNTKGNVLTNASYRIINFNDSTAFVKDTLTNIYYIIKKDGTKKPLFQKYDIKDYSEQANMMLLQDPKTKLLGLGNAEGKVLQSCKYYAASWIDEKNGTIFFKKYKKEHQADTLYLDENADLKNSNLLYNDFLLFDNKSKQLTSVLFKKPIYFYENGIGVGIVNDKSGVFDTKGKIVIPPQYDSIIIEKDIIYLAKKWQDTSYIWGFANDKGKIISEPKWSNFSKFYGNYALLTTNGKMNLINKEGQLLLPPILDNNNSIDTINILDSLMLCNYSLEGFLEAFNNSKENQREIDLLFEPYFNVELYAKLKKETPNDKAQAIMNKMLELNSNKYFIKKIEESLNYNSPCKTLLQM